MFVVCAGSWFKMSATISRFFCCRKREVKAGQRLPNEMKDANTDSLQAVEAISPMKDSYDDGRLVEGSESNGTSFDLKPTTDLQNRVHDLGTKSKDLVSDELDLQDLLNCVDQAEGSVVAVSEEEWNGYQLIKQHLEVVQKEKLRLETEVAQARQAVRDLKHEIAVLQKRLQEAENRLPNASPPPPPLPPPLPPPANHLRSLFTIIQKSRRSRAGEGSPSQEIGSIAVELDALSGRPCPGMSEVVETIRGGVSLRHVILEHKGTFQADEDQTEIGNSQMVPELYRILKKRRVSSDSHISGGSEDLDPVEASLPPRKLALEDGPSREGSPGENDCPGLPQETEREGEGAEGESDGTQSDEAGDGVSSTTSTLPLTAPLDRACMSRLDRPSVDSSCALPQLEGEAQRVTGAVLKRLDCGDPSGAGTQKSNFSADPADQSPVLNFSVLEEWNVGLSDVLPLKPDRSSVSCWTHGGGGGGGDEQHSVHQSPGSPPLVSCFSPSPASQDFSRVVLEKPQSQFALFHDVTKPTLAVRVSSPLESKSSLLPKTV